MKTKISKKNKDTQDTKDQLNFIIDTWAVKYRPKILDDVVGNKRAVQVINQFIEEKRLLNTILIHGPSGAGKTTLARIIARTVNETNEDSYDPDLNEVNCADDRGIDAVRSLIESSSYLPTKNLKFYILDECHALTSQAASALFKQLESSNRNSKVCWILVTSEAHKLPKPIIGRALQIGLEPFDEEDLLPLVHRICNKEKVFQPLDKYRSLFSKLIFHSGFSPRELLQLLQEASLLWQSNKKNLNEDLLVKSISSTMGINLDTLAVKMLLAIYSKKPGCIKLLKEVGNGNYRSFINTMLYLNNGLIDNIINAPKWQPPIQMIFINKFKELRLDNSLGGIFKTHKFLTDIKSRFFSNIDEYNLLVSEIGLMVTKKD